MVNQEPKKEKKYRRLYPYTCTGCGTRHYTLVYKRLKGLLCRKCNKLGPVPGQEPLFSPPSPGPEKPAEPSRPLMVTEVVEEQTPDPEKKDSDLPF